MSHPSSSSPLSGQQLTPYEQLMLRISMTTAAVQVLKGGDPELIKEFMNLAKEVRDVLNADNELRAVDTANVIKSIIGPKE